MAVLLTRTIRFCLNDPIDETDWSAEISNSYAAWPTMRGLGRYYELDVTCRGEPDERTGYFINIKSIDEVVRRQVIPQVSKRILDRETPTSIIVMMHEVIKHLNQALGGIVDRVDWRLTPFFSISMRGEDMSKCVVRQQFSFAASHRLHVSSLSDEENRRLFGKCNNSNGHGHNYKLETAVKVDAQSSENNKRPLPFDAAELEALVRETVIERFDHKNLNADCAEFADLNPSVENIARVCYELLEPAISNEGVALREVRIWETEKTSCTYPG